MPSEHNSRSDGPIPPWLPILCVGAGIPVMLLALDIIPVDPSKVNAPRWVLFSAGLTFALAGLVMSLVPLRHQHPARYMFACSLMCTTFFLVGAWVALFATGIQGAIGPVAVTGPAADLMGRVIFGFGAVLLGVLMFYSWRQWWRALRGQKIDLG
jgi:hypothetical protein